jgi:lysophospholipase L1-like esterase
LLLSLQADVLVRGFSGYQSRWWAGPLFNEMRRIGELQGVQMAIIFLGSNDARLTGSPKGVPQALYVSPEEFEKNMNQLVDKLVEEGVQHVVLVSPPPVCDEQLLQYGHTVSLLGVGVFVVEHYACPNPHTTPINRPLPSSHLQSAQIQP